MRLLNRRMQDFVCALLILFVIASPVLSQDQQTLQLWLDYDPTYPMGRTTFDLEITTHLGFAAQRWGELGLTPNWEFAATNWLDLSGGMSLTYTRQSEDFDSFEFNPYVEIKPYFYTKHGVHGVKLVDYLRFEYRAQYTFTEKERKNSTRIRNKVQAMIPLNKASVIMHGALSAIVDVEAFFNAGELRERFSSRLRFRLGAAYIKNTTWRYQFYYTLQRARDTIDEPFSTTDSIFRFRVIHFF